MEVIYEKIKPNGELELPQRALDALGVDVGGDVTIEISDGELKIASRKSSITLTSMRGILKETLRERSKKLVKEIRDEDQEFDT